MLSSLRAFSNTLIAKLLISLLSLSFAFWGISGFFRSNYGNNVAEINGKEISSNEFINEINKITKITNKKLNKEIAEVSLSNIISKNLINLYSKEIGVIINDQSIITELKNIPEFQNNKIFSRVKYEKFLLEKNINSQIVENQISEDLKKRIIQDSIIKYIPINKFILYEFNNYNNESLNVEYINLQNFKIQNEINEKDIQKFYDENKNYFVTEEFRSFKYTELTPENLIGQKDISNKFYEIIDKIENDISKDFKYENLIKNYKINTIKTNLLNKNGIDKNKQKINLDPALIKKIFQLSKNQIKIIEIDNKYYLIYFDNIEPSIQKILDEDVKINIKNILLKQNKKKQISKSYSDLKKKDYQEFYNFAKKNNLQIEHKYLKNRTDLTLVPGIKAEELYNNKIHYVYFIETNNNSYFFFNKDFIINSKSGKNPKESEQEISNKIDALYNNYLNQFYKIKINEKIINSYLKNFS